MIGTHDTMTYLNPRLWIFRLFTWLWRTQTKTIDEQIEAGAKYIDIRVRCKGTRWILCHGLVDLQGEVHDMRDIVRLCENHGLRARLILERGDTACEAYFRRCIYPIKGHPRITFMAIKKGWRVLKDQDPEIVDCTYVPFHTAHGFWWNLRHMKISTIERWAKKHNPPVTDEILRDDKVYFIDRL